MNPLYNALRRKPEVANYPAIELPMADLGDITPGDKIVATVAFTVRSIDDTGTARVQIDMISRNGHEEKDDGPIYVKTQESHG